MMWASTGSALHLAPVACQIRMAAVIFRSDVSMLSGRFRCCSAAAFSISGDWPHALAVLIGVVPAVLLGVIEPASAVVVDLVGR